MSKFTYILDNGHGIDKKGKRSPIWKGGDQLLEYDFNRKVLKYLLFMLRQHKISCENLVPEENDISLSERVKRVNEIVKNKPSVLISIHGNAFTQESVHGFETHYYDTKSTVLAKTFQKHLKKLGKDRGIKQSNFYIIKNVNIPAVLTENGFYTNEIECRKMMSPEFQYDIANMHLEAIKEYERINI